MAARKPRAVKPVDEHNVRELQLYLENDEPLYRRTLEFEKSAARKICRGKYDASKAPKLWKYLADEAAQKYRKDFGTEAVDAYGFNFSVSDRKALAEVLARDFEQRVNGWRSHGDRDLAQEVIDILSAKSCKR